MSLHPKLHRLLIARQSESELKRKREKAWRKAIWTQEDIDYAERAGFMLHLRFTKILASAEEQIEKDRLKKRGYILALEEKFNRL